MNSRKLAKESLVVTTRNPHRNIKALCDSIEPPKISHKEALAILDNQNEWRKLSLGEKLNVIKVYSYGIADELDIRHTDVYLARYKGMYRFLGMGNAMSIRHGISLNISKMKTASNVRNTVAEEMRHIRHFYEVDGDFKPKTALPEAVIDDLKNNWAKAPNGFVGYIGKSEHDERPMEIDAHNFVESYTKKTFSEYKAHVPDNFYEKLSLSFERLAKSVLMKYLEKKVRDVDPETNAEILNGLKSQFPYFKDVFEEIQSRKSAAKPNKDMQIRPPKTKLEFKLKNMLSEIQESKPEVLGGGKPKHQKPER